MASTLPRALVTVTLCQFVDFLSQPLAGIASRKGRDPPGFLYFQEGITMYHEPEDKTSRVLVGVQS